MANQKPDDPTPEEIAEMERLLGGKAQPIEMSPEEQAELERHMAYVEKYGHQP